MDIERKKFQAIVLNSGFKNYWGGGGESRLGKKSA